MFALILCVSLGICLIILSIKGYSTEPKATILVGVLFIIVGVAAFLLSEDIVVGELAVTIGLFAFSYALAGILLFAIITNISKIFEVNTKIKGTYVGKHQKRGGLFPIYTFSFEYDYGKSHYTQSTSDTFGVLAAAKYKEGRDYNIWIYDKKPSVMAVRRSPGAGTVCMICMFIALILIPIGYVTGFYG